MPRKFDRVPELSLKSFTLGDAPGRRLFIDALIEGFQYFGFIVLKDHAVSRELLARAYALSKEFFDLPLEEKLKCAAGPDGQRGYTPFGREHAKDAKVADLKEFYHVGREFAFASPLAGVYPANKWPERPARFRETFLALYAALEEAGFAMLEALAPSLGVKDGYFRAMATNGNSI
ncbi:MAG: 2-oxoglutarate and iron-dependent oxygenase domain-containing protein, partial [Parvularculaceae bacterium]|nr:2-oxoglutarate and iron-dependent oxygenase domain-containing protein [Parvularculaceae bacterium]